MHVRVAVLGIDIGGSAIKAGAVDLASGRVLGDDVQAVPTPRPAPPSVVVDAVASVLSKVPELDSTEGDVGCTFPGRIRAGTSLAAVNLSPEWVGLRPGDYVEEALRTIGGKLGHELSGRAVHALNDADAAGLAEMHFGAGRDRDGVVLMVTLGTGIGSALFVDGELVPGTELGEVDVDGQPAASLASRTAREELGLSWEQWATNVGRFLQRMQDLIDPALIIVGGGVSEHPEVLRPALAQPVEVLVAELGNAAGVIGAAWFAAHCSSA